MFLLIITHKKKFILQVLERLKTFSKITVKYYLKVYLTMFLLIIFLMKVFFFLKCFYENHLLDFFFLENIINDFLILQVNFKILKNIF